MNKLRLYSWIEFGVWIIILAVVLMGVKIHNKNMHKRYKNYQIFVSDADGLIVGSPVRYTGVQIGYVNKIQIISSNVYIRFLVTEKDFELPAGVIATVEGSGLGGSKSVEIYPPDSQSVSDKLIETKDPVRLNRVMGLFKNMFKELDQIITTIGSASRNIREDLPERIIENNEIKKNSKPINLTEIDKQLDSATEKAKKLGNDIKRVEEIIDGLK